MVRFFIFGHSRTTSKSRNAPKSLHFKAEGRFRINFINQRIETLLVRQQQATYAERKSLLYRSFFSRFKSQLTV